MTKDLIGDQEERNKVWAQVDRDLAKRIGEAEMKRIDKIVAQAKKKEFDRLVDYSLNLMSLIEVGLNRSSVSRNPYSCPWIFTPSLTEIETLHKTLLELRENILTSEERELLLEQQKQLHIQKG